MKKLHGGPFLWLAHKGHYEFCHFDPDDNFLLVFKGQKRVRLFPAQDIDKLYPNPLGSKGKTIQSRVDCDDPDMEQYPMFRDAQCIEVSVGAPQNIFCFYFCLYWLILVGNSFISSYRRFVASFRLWTKLGKSWIATIICFQNRLQFHYIWRDDLS